MTKFLVLYQSDITGRERMESANPEQMQASMAQWMKWKEDTGDTMVEFGSPINIGKHVTADGIIDGQANFTGYSIIQAESLDEAAKVIQSHPILKAGTTIEILEFLAMPGMEG